MPADNATGRFTRIAQRVSVRIALDEDARLEGLLRPGMSVEARVPTDREALGVGMDEAGWQTTA